MDVSNSRGQWTRIALAASASLNIALFAVVLWPAADSEPAQAAEVVATVEADQAADAPVAAQGEEPQAEAIEIAPAEVAEAQAQPEPNAAPTKAEAEAPADPDAVRVTVASVVNSIPQTLATAAAPYGDFVSATLSRLLVWDLDLRKDLRAGDKIEVAWTLGTTDTVVIQAARFFSQKHNRTIEAYRFHASGDEFPSYWAADGTEIPHQLKNSPMKKYEQITSLLKDRPTHHGMDFKAAVGSPIQASFEGVVTRTNWNWAANGNCVEVQHKDGVLAKYLHLAENKVKPGDRVRPGDIIALSGNTGRSTGPHLHYQLNQGSKVIDPVNYHGTTRRSLPASDKAAFEAAVAAANAQLDAAGPLAAN